MNRCRRNRPGGGTVSSFAFRDQARNSDNSPASIISGVINDDQPLLDLIRMLSENGRGKGAGVSISSPAATTYGGERKSTTALVRARQIQACVADIHTLAARQGYMIAVIKPTYKFAGESSIVGSNRCAVSVMRRPANFLDKSGVRLEANQILTHEGRTSPFHEDRRKKPKAMIRSMVLDSYAGFCRSGSVTPRHGRARKCWHWPDGSISHSAGRR